MLNLSYSKGWMAKDGKRNQGPEDCNGNPRKKGISYQYLYWKMIFKREETGSVGHTSGYEGNQTSGEDG